MAQNPIILGNITLQDTVSELTEKLPFQISVRDLHDFRNNRIPWQWHPEAELFYMLEGRMEYRTAHGIFVFEKGDAGFVNPELLHLTSCEEALPCKQKVITFLPRFIGEKGSAIEEKYVLPLTENRRIDVLKFPAGSDMAARLRSEIIGIENAFVSRDYGYEIETRSLLSRTWLYLVEMAERAPKKAETHIADEQRIKNMLSLMESSYSEKIELKSIAEAGGISERECTRCFNRQLGQPPYEYLLDLRIEKACEMLGEFKDSVKDVAAACGFGTANNFGKVFKEKTGMTPSEYRHIKAGEE